MRRADDGFTLLEILIVAVLTALVVTFASRSFVSLSKAQERTLEENQRDRLAEIVLDRMERELAGTLLLVKPDDVEPVDHPWLFRLIDDVFQGEDADSLRFVTESPARVAGDPVAGAFRIVSYAVRTGTDGGLHLYREEEAFPEQRALDLPPFEEPPAVRNVARFNVRARDDKTDRPADTWDSTGEATEDRLPAGLELSLQLLSRAPSGERVPGQVFTRSIALPVRPIGGEEDEDCTGPSVQECLSRFAEVLATLGPEAEETVAELTEQVEGSCFATTLQTEEGQILSDSLRQLTQLEPEEICQ